MHDAGYSYTGASLNIARTLGPVIAFQCHDSDAAWCAPAWHVCRVAPSLYMLVKSAGIMLPLYNAHSIINKITCACFQRC